MHTLHQATCNSSCELTYVVQRCSGVNFLLWLLLDSHVIGTGNSLVQNRPSIYLLWLAHHFSVIMWCIQVIQLSTDRTRVCLSVCHTPVLYQLKRLHEPSCFAGFAPLAYTTLCLKYIKLSPDQTQGTSLWKFVPNTALRKCGYGTSVITKRQPSAFSWQQLHGDRPHWFSKWFIWKVLIDWLIDGCRRG